MGKQITIQTNLIQVNVNGKIYEISAKPNETLLDILRNHLQINSVKAACWQGDCGVCTVLFEGIPAKSCLVLAHEAHQKEITTVEGLTDQNTLSRLQELFIQHDAVQCGFCTSAFLLMGHHLLKQERELSRNEVALALSGILCRCTGYKQIIDSFIEASFEKKNE
ncbi:MAG: (2Fe-2S)-binding protein [Candidatus Hodarchaeales archaeon]|jgi:carbon-monoxide dehydrogenase small subunit